MQVNRLVGEKLNDFLALSKAISEHSNMDDAIAALRRLAKISDRSTAIRLFTWLDTYSQENGRRRLYIVPSFLVVSWPDERDMIVMGVTFAPEGPKEEGDPGVRFVCTDCGTACPTFDLAPGWHPFPIDTLPKKLERLLILKLLCPACCKLLAEEHSYVEVPADHDYACTCELCRPLKVSLAGFLATYTFVAIEGETPFEVLRELYGWLNHLMAHEELSGVAHVHRSPEGRLLVSTAQKDTLGCVSCKRQSELTWPQDGAVAPPPGWGTALWAGDAPPRIEALALDFLLCPDCLVSHDPSTTNEQEGEASHA